MKNILYTCCIGLCLSVFTGANQSEKKRWISLFNGKDLSGWRVGNNVLLM